MHYFFKNFILYILHSSNKLGQGFLQSYQILDFLAVVIATQTVENRVQSRGFQPIRWQLIPGISASTHPSWWWLHFVIQFYLSFAQMWSRRILKIFIDNAEKRFSWLVDFFFRYLCSECVNGSKIWFQLDLGLVLGRDHVDRSIKMQYFFLIFFLRVNRLTLSRRWQSVKM